VQEIYFLIIKY